MTLAANIQPAFPDQLPLPLNAPHPSAGRNQAARSREFKVRPIQEHSAIAASKVCRPSNDQNRFQDPHLFRGQRLLVVAVSAAAAVVAAAIVQASKDVDFLFP